jgi:hypothetical protein
MAPKITITSDPTIPSDYDKIEQLLKQKKSWRSYWLKCALTPREIANYFEGHHADSIKKRYHLCKRVLMETFTPEEVHQYQFKILIFRMKS